MHYWLLGLGLHRARDLTYGLYPGNGVQLNDGLVSLDRIAGPGVPGPVGSWLNQGQYLGPGGHRLSGDVMSRPLILSTLAIRLVRRRMA